MGTPSLETAKGKVEMAKSIVEMKKNTLAKAKERLADLKKSSNWKTMAKNCSFPGKPGHYRAIEVEVFSRQRELEEAKKVLASAKEDLARAKELARTKKK